MAIHSLFLSFFCLLALVNAGGDSQKPPSRKVDVDAHLHDGKHNDVTNGKLYARADVRSSPSSGFNIAARFEFFGSVDGDSTFVKVKVLSGLVPGLSTSGAFPYHVHTNFVPSDGNCTKTLAHLDPYNVTESIICDPAFPQYCQEGDLSGKHGKLNGTEGGDIQTFGYSDAYLRFFPQDVSILGRSIVIHSANKTRLACGNITSLLDGTEDGHGKPTKSPSTFVVNYPSKAPTNPTPVITPLNGTVFTDASTLSTYPYPLPLPALSLKEALNITLSAVTQPVTITPVGQTSPSQVDWTFVKDSKANYIKSRPFDGSVEQKCNAFWY